ncbi:ABC transporter transmembrane domain-containing protein [Romboutsia sp.]|uniref:ABC transporter transmembrane domain-containing protein n=1 Tax=Romboutsia sp. TaxID=1965302 RepID=UPI002ED504EE
MRKQGFNKEDKKFSKDGLVNLMEYLKRYNVFLIMALLFAIGGSAITVYSPDRLSEITDLITQGIMTGIDIDRIKEIGILLVGLYLISIILSYSQSFIMATITQKTTNKLRSDISNKINRLPLKYYDKNTVGDVLSRVTNDVDTIDA